MSQTNAYAADLPPPKTAVTLSSQNLSKNKGLDTYRQLALRPLLLLLLLLAGPTAGTAQTTTDVTLSLSHLFLAEWDGQDTTDTTATAITVTATLPQAVSQDITVTLALGTTAPPWSAFSLATSGTDYTATFSGTITITQGETSGTATLNIDPIFDTTVEGNEALLVTGSGTDLRVTPVELVLTDGPYVSFAKMITTQVFYPSDSVAITLPALQNTVGTASYAIAPTTPGFGLTFDSTADPPTLTGSIASNALPSDKDFVNVRHTITVTDNMGTADTSDDKTATTIVSVNVIEDQCTTTTDDWKGTITTPGTGLIKDCNILLAAKDTLRGTGTLNWATSLPLSQWTTPGHKFDADGFTKLNTPTPLNGTLSPVLGGLAKMENLYFDNNGLTGTVPPELGSLSSLKHLNLTNISLTGAIPPELGDAANLETLYLSGNSSFDKGPIPPELSRLAKLRAVHLQKTNRTGPIPAELGKLTKLESSDLSSGTLSGPIPSTLGALKKLKKLNLACNFATGLPPALGDITALESLIVNNNALTGTIPPELGTLANLTFLDLGHLSLNPPPPPGTCGTNQLTGTIPPELGKLSNLTYLNLRGNQLSGSIPPDLGKLSSLEDLNLRGNQLSGSIPATWGGASHPLSNLEGLYLRNNQLSGPIPASLGNLSNLKHFDLRNNQLSGAIPASLGNLGKAGSVPNSLDWLLLSGNNLSGSIPSELGDLTGLTYFFLHRNQLEDPLPDTFINLTGLRGFLFDYNESACLPDNLDNEWYDQRSFYPGYQDTVEVHCVFDPPAAPTAAAPNSTSLTVNWGAYSATGFTTSHYEVQYRAGTTGKWQTVPYEDTKHPTSATSYTLTSLTTSQSYQVRYRALDDIAKTDPTDPTRYVGTKWSPSASATPTAPTTGGGGGGGGQPVDRHGNTPATATAVSVENRPAGRSVGSRISGSINSQGDLDYFRIDVPQPGWLLVETTGFTDTLGTLWDEGELLGETALAEDNDSGTRRNFRIPLRVRAGTYLLAVAGRQSSSVGNYVLNVALFVGYLENPQPDSPQSGISVLSGWVCAADSVVFQIEDDPLGTFSAATGTARPDTASECDGQTDTGFGLLYNWNRLGDGEHTVRLVLNGITVETRTVTVKTLGEEFLSGATGETTLEDFPAPGEAARLVWQQAQQNFLLVPPQSGPTVPVPWSPLPAPLIGWWENPQPGSFQSGLSVLSGWVCEADSVVFEIEADPLGTFPAAAGTVRPDTEAECDGQTDTGFGLLYNWNRLGDGEHTVRLVIDGVVIDTRTVTVTTLGEEFRRGLKRTETVADFPSPGEVVTVEWQEAQQNFVMTGVEDEE